MTQVHAEANPRVEVTATRDFQWLTDRSRYVPLPDGRGIVALHGARPIGMVVFDGFTETIAQVHLALETPLASIALLRPAFHYAFIQANLQALVTSLDSRHDRANALAVGLGFREGWRILNGVAMGADMILYEMRREWCRFIPGVH